MISIKEWIICILIGAFIVNIVNMMLPENKLKPYINLVASFIFIFIVISPVVGFLSEENLEDKILEKINLYNKRYLDTDEKAKVDDKSLNRQYEENLKNVLKLKLEQSGYELEDIELDGSDVKNIKIKEKSNGESIEAFNDNKKPDEKSIKDDLIKIFKISVDKIEID